MRARFAISVAAAVCATATALPVTAYGAATPAPGGGPPPPGPSPTGQATPGGQTPTGTEVSTADRAFLTQAAQGAQFEVASGRLAANRAASAAVQSFGRRMVTDHGEELQQLQALDHSLGVGLSSAPNTDQRNLAAIWTSVRGGAFDCSYAPAIYALHGTDVHVFEQEAAHADNAQVRQFAAAQLPVLRQHLQMASKNLGNLDCSAPAATPS
ncbi:DUF4142 domain-containing protein [Dactylosporangium sp. CA-052675]|uniref:DUF4142 domain-containing protein n=1 Tax=Dactylosporangium sp. CA-052675 TaxID=3239927 RepID=UPI003D8DCBEC